MTLHEYIVRLINAGEDRNMIITTNAGRHYHVWVADHDLRYCDYVPEDVQETDIDDLLILNC